MVHRSWDEKMTWCHGIAGQPECTEKLTWIPDSEETPQSYCFQASSSLNMPPSCIRNCLITCMIYHTKIYSALATVAFMDNIAQSHLIKKILCVQLEQVTADVSSDRGYVDTWVPSHHRLPVGSHQKLFKVPLDVADLNWFPKQPPISISKVAPYWRTGILHDKKHS